MLLRFRVRNFKSYRDEQSFNMVATKLRGGLSQLIKVPGSDLALPFALIYGANAAGKSTILEAISGMRGEIISSHAQRAPNAPIGRAPFAFSEDGQRATTEYECDFVVHGVRYSYGFEEDTSEFVSEWLYLYEGGSRKRWFSRTREDVLFGRDLRGPNKTIQSLMRPNSLFLSAAAQNAHMQLTPIYTFFQDYFDYADNNINALAVSRLYQDGINEKVLAF